MSNFASRTPADFDRIRALVEGTDELAAGMERKWGVDRLPRLVSDEPRTRFYAQARKFNLAVLDGSPADVDVEGQRMRNAWMALDALAEAAGAQTLSPDVWEVRLSDGRLAALVRTREEQFALAHDGRRADVYTAGEIANLIEGFPEIAVAKKTFPGAMLTAVRVSTIDWDKGDAMPDSMLGAG